MGYPNWFKLGAIDHFKLILPKLYAGQENLNFLQIGAYTGDASEWLLDNIITHESSWLTDVDTWCGSDEEVHKEFDWNELEKFYDKRMSKYKNICKIKGYSADFLQSAQENYYDFIYIDGDHRASEVYKDATFGWRCLKIGGIMAFDDYMWRHDSGDIMFCPMPGINQFLQEYSGKFQLLIMFEQVWIRKNV